MRLDEGEGGIAAGRAWLIFDHDLMRVAGGWTGEGFIDWRAILLNGEHNIYPRITGDLHFENPVAPGWADPRTGSFEDPRFHGLDGRPFGPLPRDWAHYKGLYYHGRKVVVKYAVGDAEVHESFGLEYDGDRPVFTRTLNISPGTGKLHLRIAPSERAVAVSGTGAALYQDRGFHQLEVRSRDPLRLKLWISRGSAEDLEKYAAKSPPAADLTAFTAGGRSHYPERLESPGTPGEESAAYAVDVLP